MTEQKKTRHSAETEGGPEQDRLDRKFTASAAGPCAARGR